MSVGWFVVEHADCRWAVPGGAVRRVDAAGDRVRLTAPAAVIEATRVLATVRTLRVTPVGSVLRWLGPEGCTGVSVWRDQPVVVVDPDRPPTCLVQRPGATGESSNEELTDGI